MDRNKTYLVLNYSKSAVGLSTRNDSYIIDGGNSETPASLPFTIDEIVQINNGSDVFTSGMLRFEKEYEAEIYEELRIRNWREIMTDDEIEEIIKNPTAEKLETFIGIKNEYYFERIYGIFIGLLNEGFPISQKVQNVLRARRFEFAHNKLTSQIQIIPKENKDNEVQEDVDKLKSQNADMAKQLAEMKAMMEKLSDKKTTDTIKTENKPTESTKPVRKAGRPKKITK